MKGSSFSAGLSISSFIVYYGTREKIVEYDYRELAARAKASAATLKSHFTISS